MSKKRFVIENNIWYLVEEKDSPPPFPKDLPSKIQKLVDKHDPKEVKMGYKVEFEHNKGATDVVDKPLDSLKIALAHLEEDPKYYTHLAAMEKKYVKESPDGVFVGHGDKKRTNVTDWRDLDAIVFGFDSGNAYIAPEPRMTHTDMGIISISPSYYIESLNMTEDEIADYYGDIIGFDRANFEYPGRMWTKRKIISFWEYPEFSNLKNVLKKLEDEYKEIYGKPLGIMNFKIEIPADDVSDEYERMNSWGSYSDIMSSSANRKAIGGKDWIGGGYLYSIKNVLKPNFKLKGQGKEWKGGTGDIRTNKDIQHQVSPLLKKGKINKLNKKQKQDMWDYFKNKGKLDRDEKKMWKMLSRHMGVKEDREFIEELIENIELKKTFTLEEGTGILTEAPHIEVGDQIIDLEFEQGKLQGMRRILKILVGIQVEDKYGNIMRLTSPKDVQEFLRKLAKNSQVKREL